MDQQETVKELGMRIDGMGDLPVFSASVNRIRKISVDPESDSMDLAKEVMKDLGFSVKLLRLANSSYYNRGLGKISSVSRAVVLLGFNTVKNLGFTLKFIESFKAQHPGVDMEKMLVRSYLAAGFVRDIALKAGVKDPEESYICALLHNLGEMVCGYFMPEKFLELQKLQQAQEMPAIDAERAVLGVSLVEIGKQLASQWEFPSSVIKTMDKYTVRKDAPVCNSTQLNGALASLASQMLDLLYLDPKSPNKSFQQLLGDISQAAGLKVEAIETSLSDSFKMSCDLAREFGISGKVLQPIMQEGDDEAREKTARLFSYYAAHQVVPPSTIVTAAAVVSRASQAESYIDSGDTPVVTKETGEVSAAIRHSGDPMRQLEILQEITTLMAGSATITSILLKVLEGIYQGVGFERVVLCLVNRDRASYVGRIALGNDAPHLKEYFTFAINPQRDLFSKLIMEGGDVCIEDCQEPPWRDLMREDFIRQVKATTFMVSALRHQNKPIGAIYADKLGTAARFSPEERRGFLQFIAQARFALQVGK